MKIKKEELTYCVCCLDNFEDWELNELNTNPVCFVCSENYEEANK